MPKQISTLHDILADQLKDIYSAETQIAKALPKMAKAATDADLKSGFEEHLEQTKTHVERIKTICEELEIKPTGKKCAATAGLVQEGEEAIAEEATPEAKDLMLIGAARRVEHYEMACYRCAVALAEALELESVVATLNSTLEEEEATDEKLSEASESLVSEIDKSEGDEDEEED